MKKESIWVIFLICVAVAGLLFYEYSKSKKSGFQILDGSTPVVRDGSTIAWEGFEDGMAVAKKEGKPIFLYFHAQWCTYCKKLKKTTFKDKDILTYLSQNFISIMVDTDKYPKLTKEWKVTGLPTLWFLKPDGSKISSIPGFVTSDQLINILKYINTKKYETITFREFLKTL